MSEAKGIKESLELVKGVELLGVTAQEILADGKLNGEDLDSGLKLITNAQVLIAAVDGLGDADDELKDLDEAEMIQLGSALFSAIKAIKAAKKK